MTDGLHRAGARPLFGIARPNKRSATKAERPRSEALPAKTCQDRVRAALVYILIGVAASFVSVAVGVLVWDAIKPTSWPGRVVPVLAGTLVAIGSGIWSVYLVPWLLAGGLRLLTSPIQHGATTTDGDERPC